MERLSALIEVLKLASTIKIETGDLETPDGTPYHGFKVVVGGLQNNAEVIRTYADIERIFKSREALFKTHETDDLFGHFRTYTVSTN
ncbi:hypothetical protein HY345_04280 [Candidatus Microgenomates bacterium]|nr:hypothetical protein [Candidatus Microgenomates bacterium]